MILKKEKNGNIVEVMYESSNILKSRYDEASTNLTITFKNGSRYTYLSVPKTTYFRFETAESQGKFLNTEIKKYQFIKEEGEPNIIEMINEVDKLKESEKYDRQNDLVMLMSGMVTQYRSGVLLSDTILNKLKSEVESLLING
jgi:hypothetical protein